jgi:hypothetical protein
MSNTRAQFYQFCVSDLSLHFFLIFERLEAGFVFVFLLQIMHK